MVKNDKDLLFQITDWRFYHEYDAGEVDEDAPIKYKIQLFGTTPENKKIYVRVDGYNPYFFIEIPKRWRKQHAETLVNSLKDRVPDDLRNSLKEWGIVDRHKFYGFTNYKMYNFIILVFHSYEGFREYEKACRYPIKNAMLSYRPYKCKLYESNIEPMLRCMHRRDVQACGHVKIPAKKYTYFRNKDNPSINEINVITNWENLFPMNDNSIVPLIVASYDIECTSGDGSFPQPERDSDQIIQIGTTFNYYGESECFYKHIITLGSCDPIEGVDVESYDKEEDVLLAWRNLMLKMNPDVVTGYNIFGFDYRYLDARAKKLGVDHTFSKLGRLVGEKSEFVEKTLSSSALGDNILKYYDMKGRVQVDLLKVIQRDFTLSSYKLDAVASEFIREVVRDIDVDKKAGTTTIYTGSTYGLSVDRYIKIVYFDGLSDNTYKDGIKFKVLELGQAEKDGKKYNTIKVNGILDGEAQQFNKYKVSWCQAKDDVTAQDIFRLQKGSSADRATVARYCIQDCVLVNKLMEKLQVLTNNIGMSNVCYVPLSYIFLRGQGIKIFSLVSKKCRERRHLIPVVRKKRGPDVSKMTNAEKKAYEKEKELNGYEGATVLPPDKGIHFEPIPVLDYASLYPRSMIHRNVSHEMIVTDENYDNLPGYRYENVTFYNKDGTSTTCRYAKATDGRMGILPEILKDLLDARENTRNQIGLTPDPFKKKILDGLQLAYKVTANSLYGQTGAETSPIYYRNIAASTTATGREMLMGAKLFSEEVLPLIVECILNNDWDLYNERMEELFNTNSLCGILIFPGYKANEELFNKPKPDRTHSNLFTTCKTGYTNREEFKQWYWDMVLEALEDRKIDIKCIYGDTDSVFVNFGISDAKTGKRLSDHDTLVRAIKIGVLCGDLINIILPPPHNLEYEKTFWPFIIHTKKRYVGNLYESDPNKFYQKSMGIVLKRRDNAPIVKIIVGGIVDKILNEKSAKKAVDFTRTELKNILCNKYPLEKFIITKTLKAEYKDRTSITHAVLADRMGERDPGCQPQSNDRIPYAYIETKYKPKLQGDRVEHPDFIIENKLKLDYLFYITNQIMKPAVQFLEYIVDDPEKIFNDYVIREMNRRKGLRPINSFFDVKHNKELKTEVKKKKGFSLDETEEWVLKPKPKDRNKAKRRTVARKTVTKKRDNDSDDDLDGFRIEI